jgi:DNA-binding MarR family transcriptional regulator
MYLLNQANQAVRSRLEQDLRAIGLTGIQYTVLTIVAARDGISSAELSRRFFVTPQTMNEIVAGLERRGLLARVESPQSRRILTARITPSGSDLLAEADAIADQIEGEAFSHLSDEDFDELRRLLRVQLNAVRGEPEEKKAAAAAS